MTGTDRALRMLALTVDSSTRPRFLEEWLTDVAAARSVGLSPWQIVVAAARVAGFLLWVRVRAAARRARTPGERAVAGIALGFVLVAVDAPIEDGVPFVLIAIGWRGWTAVQAWIRAPR